MELLYRVIRSHSYLSKLNKLQNKALRIVLGKSWIDSAYPLYQYQHILPLPLMIKFKTVKLLHEHKNSHLTFFNIYFYCKYRDKIKH